MLSPIKEFVVADEGKQNEENVIDETNNFNGIERSILVDDSQPLARCSVLYLGTAIPLSDQYGIDSIQNPLSKRYPVDGSEIVRGIEAWLSIDDNGLQIQFASDPSVVLYYPIRSLVYCASVRFTSRSDANEHSSDHGRFIPLDSPDAGRAENAQNPPVFAAVFHRTRHQPADECHSFITKTKQIALALVQACSNAYQQTDPEQDCSKVPLYFKILNNGAELKEVDDEISLVPVNDEDATANYETDNKTAGFFYKTQLVPIDSWQLWENPKNSLRRSSSVKSMNSPHYRRRLASIASITDAEELITTPPNPTPPPPPPLLIDPYAPNPNVLRVERIKDMETGRDIYIRWLKSPSEVVQPSPIPIYDFQMKSNMIDQLKKEVELGLERLALEEQARKSSKTKKKKKHHKHHKHHKHPKSYREEYVSTPIFTPAQPSYSQGTFEPKFFHIDAPSPLPSTPFWFYSM